MLAETDVQAAYTPFFIASTLEANMTGGRAKERINLPGIALGLPTTVSGSDYRISFKPDVAIETIKFQSPNGPLTVQIAMRPI